MAVEAVVSVVIHKLTNLLIEEPHLFEKVIDEVERVRIELREMQIFLNDAEHHEKGDNSLTGWATKFLSKVYQVEFAIETFALAKTRLKRMGFVKKHGFVVAKELKLCRQVPDEMDYTKSVSRFKSKMNEIGNQLEELKHNKPSLAPAVLHKGSIVHPMHPQVQPWQANYTYYAPNREETIFKKDVEKLVNQLTNDSKPLQIISVFGDIGSGKTTHSKTVFNKVKNKFECHASVVVPAKCSVRHLLVAILRQMTSLKDNEKLKDDEDLRGRLYEFLKEKHYLIIINDIRNGDLLEHLRGALPDNYKGSRVVITTPDEGAALFADASSRYHFNPLDMEDGFIFFTKKVPALEESPLPRNDTERLKIKIAETCKGIPMKISLLAGLLSTRKVGSEDWWSVFNQLDTAVKSPSFDIVSFCYNDLPLQLKPCFLYLGLFRKGFEIPVRRLFRLWLAEGFVKQSPGMIVEDIAEGYLEELVNRNMVEISKKRSDESPKKCKMNGVLHDIFLPKAVEIGLFYLHKKSEEESDVATPFGVRRVVEYTNIKHYPTSNAFCRDLQSYISFNARKKDTPAKEVGIFLERIIGNRGFGLLMVLDLEGVYRPWLPENLGNLFHLRYLGLRWTFLETLPSSLGDLLYLETLDIKHTHITALPSSIWIMKHLRHLCLNEIRLDISSQKPKHRSLNQLQTLWGLFVDETNAAKIGLTLKRMTNIRKLGLTRQTSSTTITTTTTTTTTRSQSSAYEEIDMWISSLSSLQSLRLRSKDRMGRPSELIIKPLTGLENLSQLYLLGHLRKPIPWYQFPPAVKVLTLSVSKIEKDPMPKLSQMPSLIVLRLLADSYVGEEMHCPSKGFPALRVLKIWKLEKLKIWTVDKETMQNLQTIDIRCCQELAELPTNLLQIKSFENLILTNMPKPFVSAIRKNKQQHTKIVEKELDS